MFREWKTNLAAIQDLPDDRCSSPKSKVQLEGDPEESFPTRDGLSPRAQMLTRSEGCLLLGEDVTLVARGVSQWESADLRPRGRSDGANRPIAHGRSPDRWLQNRFCGQEFPCGGRDGCGRRDNKTCTRPEAA